MADTKGQEELRQSLVQKALEAREQAYCPYSHFAVGAALLCADGTVVTGCNVECASASPGNCAERTAIFKAVSQGRRDFTAIAVAGGAAGREPEFFCSPCGVCRQVMREFCRDDFEIILTDGRELEVHTLGELLPVSFGPDNLEQEKA